MKLFKTIFFILILSFSFITNAGPFSKKGPAAYCKTIIGHFISHKSPPSVETTNLFIMKRITQIIPRIQSNNPEYQEVYDLIYEEFQKTVTDMINEIPPMDRMEALTGLKKSQFDPDLFAFGICDRKTKCMKLKGSIQNEMASMIVFIHEFDHIVHYFKDKENTLLTRGLETQAFKRQYRFMKEMLSIINRESFSSNLSIEENFKLILSNMDELTRIELKKVRTKSEEEFIKDYLSHSSYAQRIYMEEVVLKSLRWWRNRLPF